MHKTILSKYNMNKQIDTYGFIFNKVGSDKIIKMKYFVIFKLLLPLKKQSKRKLL